VLQNSGDGRPPWHCVCVDSAYFDADSYDHIIPTAWIPLLDVDADNGTLQVIAVDRLSCF